MRFCLLLLFTISALISGAQTGTFSHRLFRLGVDDGVIVVPEVAGMNHLWMVSPNLPVRIQVYDKQLEWVKEQTFPVQLAQKNDLTILRAGSEYYLYNQTRARGSGFLWNVNAMGDCVDESGKVKTIIKSAFKDTSIICQFFSRDNFIYMVGSVYVPGIKKIVTTIIKLNSQLEDPVINHYAYDFDHAAESLQRMSVFPDRSLSILKKSRSDEGEFFLELLKVDLKTSRIHSFSFGSRTNFSSPEIIYNPADSSTTVYSRMGRSYANNKLSQLLFFASLDDTLGQKTAPTIIRIGINEYMNGGFAAVNVGKQKNKWLQAYGTWNAIIDPQRSNRILIGLSEIVSVSGNKVVAINADSYQPRLQPVDLAMQLVQLPADVKFSVFNNKFQNVQDTIFKYHRRYFVEVGQYTMFERNNNSYLVLKEQFPSSGKGLLLLRVNEKGVLDPYPLHVYERFHYALPQMIQTASGNLMLPYIFKREVGLARFNLENMDN